MSAAALFGALAIMGQPVAGETKNDARLVSSLSAVVDDLTRRWSDAFAAEGQVYTPPRIVYLRTPMGHPGRGSGHQSGVGVVIDLGDMEVLGRALGAEGSTLVAFVIAHEVGHHVQVLRRSSLRGRAREAQADCYAGWWLGRAAASGSTQYASANFRRRLPEAIQILSITASGRLSTSIATASHGAPAARIAGLERGLAAQDISACHAE